MTGKGGSAAAGLCSRCRERDPPRRSAAPAAPQLRCQVQNLKRDMKVLRASSLEVFRTCREHLQDGLSAVVAAVQRAQLCHEALLAWQSKAGHLERSLQEVSARYELEKQKRKMLHNRLVVSSIHGSGSEEGGGKGDLIESSVPAGVVHAIDDVSDIPNTVFGEASCVMVHRVPRYFHPESNSESLLDNADGYNVCVLAYGQTGCGKSYTMLGPHSKEARIPPWGPHSDLGIMPRAAGELFRLISENPSKSLKVDVSIVEVYNNDILDLLAKERRTEVSGPKRDAPTSKAAKREVSPPTRHAEDFIALAAGSLQLRAQLATQVHARSSRSHLIITATLTAASPCDSPADRQSPGPPLEGRPAWGRVSPGSPGAQRPAEQVHAKLQLVDLAGSECVGVSGVTGSALRETSFINRSLAALADVLGALSERRGHIPYRNSQLTHFLQDVLGGDAKLLVILCVSPCRTHVAETLRCLGFGARVRQVQRGQAGGGSVAPRKPR
ncbi:hypothetical protein GH733_000091 [Mirounga leonina]|nr:hypothetical protein GH733_000169 [Mirounga leonina]KAF3831354.1 hypothetical protein GH733_000091 [Mirounga leonina]